MDTPEQHVPILTTKLYRPPVTADAGAVIFFFVLTFAESWGALGGEAGHAMANERMLAEIAGVVVAAVSVRHVPEIGRGRRAARTTQ